ncbi:septum site-determining protein MinC [Reinekea blandensis]|uniref:Probable septum site-determining protein MinC n=1 Tax=Reinekea blandensis MED297 TaxID=314283 RepID=A4BKE0_9GAMM|nr:septum site-determining protein MinC [Reinekea blandensis]EAR07387.1 septum formation inhibitor [Reinekea sp. MED297] [Reinekea blandensis MED297]
MTASQLRLRGRLVASHQIPIQTLDLDTFRDQLDTTIAQAPALFKQAPSVLDLSDLKETAESEQLLSLIQACRTAGLVPFALTGDKSSHQPLASELGLAWIDFKAGTAPKESPPTTARTTQVVTSPVRSGQQIYARDANLLVTSLVSAGAEIAADGNIHVLGPLRGRAIAGASGDKSSEVICQQMQAELISIAGLYLVQDDFPEGQGAARCTLIGDSIRIDYL